MLTEVNAKWVSLLPTPGVGPGDLLASALRSLGNPRRSPIPKSPCDANQRDARGPAGSVCQCSALQPGPMAYALSGRHRFKRAVAQLGSAPALGAGGPGFKSRQPDSKFSQKSAYSTRSSTGVYPKGGTTVGEPMSLREGFRSAVSGEGHSSWNRPLFPLQRGSPLKGTRSFEAPPPHSPQRRP
jgi:hypothetical protein